MGIVFFIFYMDKNAMLYSTIPKTEYVNVIL